MTTLESPALSAVLLGAGIGDLDEIEKLFAQVGGSESVLDRLLADRPERESLVRRLLQEYNLSSLFTLLVPSEQSFAFESGRSHRLGDGLATGTGGLLAKAERRIEIWRRMNAIVPSAP